MPGHPAVAVGSASDKVAGMAELDIETSARDRGEVVVVQVICCLQ